MRWKISWEAVVVAMAIFALWVGLDGLYPRLSEADEGWNPFEQFGEGSAVAWFYRGGAHRGMTRHGAAGGGDLLPFLPLSDVGEDGFPGHAARPIPLRCPLWSPRPSSG